MLGVRVCPLHGPGARAAGGRAAEPAAAVGGRLPQPRRQEPRRGGGGQDRPQPQDSRPLRGQLLLFSRAQGIVKNHIILCSFVELLDYVIDTLYVFKSPFTDIAKTTFIVTDKFWFSCYATWNLF
jgi:hypothetical protein